MARILAAQAEPGPECFCGSELKSVPLPPDLAELSRESAIWVHVHNGDTRCYPDSANPEDAAATGAPAEPPMETPRQVADELFRRAFGRLP